MNAEKKYGVFVGRMYPIHLGHEKIIEEMIQTCGIDNCMVVIGSSNAKMSLRHFFSYEERRRFIKEIFPEVRIVGLPDYPEDNEWFQALDDIIHATNLELEKVTFFVGSEIDVDFFLKEGRKIHIINRYTGNTPRISATEVRDALIHERPLSKLINPKIKSLVLDTFQKKWEEFKKM